MSLQCCQLFCLIEMVWKMSKSVLYLSLGHDVGDTMVSWGYQGHHEQRAAAIIEAQLGYASMKNA